MTMVSIHDHTGRFLRPLGADLVFQLPFVANLARKAGATLACNEDAERLLTNGELVVSEGLPGPETGKGVSIRDGEVSTAALAIAFVAVMLVAVLITVW